ncbi:hypothetical protein, partial [Clostridium sp.]|uniref:hypothetical protein n=1 Tax=Clostridium sp. TaxID=1506 RepID=UPI003AA5394A
VCKICGKNPCECEKEKEAKEDVCEICGKNPCECEDDTKKEDNAKKIDEDEDKKKEDNACKKKSKNVEEDDDEDEEEIVEDEDGVKKEDEGCKKKSKNSKKTDFSLSLNNIFKGLRYALEEYTYEYTSYWGDTFTCQKYYVEDLMPEDNVAIIYDCEDGECYGVTYSVSNDDVICNLESKTIYLREWRPKVSSVKSFERKEDFKREAVLYNKVAEELHKLRQFKLDVEDRDRLSEIEGKIDGALSQFEFEEDETSELVENVKNGSLDFEMFENMLFALEGRKARAEKEKFSKQQNNNGLKITDSIEDKEVKSKYSSIIDKYGRKNK